MGEGTEGDEVDAGLGIGYHGVVGDAATALRLGASGHNLHGLLSVFGREVVEHDAVATLLQCLVQFLEIADFALYLQVLALVLAVLLGTGDGIVDAAAEVDVVVLEENHVEESDAVVHAAAYAHGLLLQHAHAGSGLAGVEDTGACAGIDEGLLIAVGHGGYAGHALQYVEHQALGLQQALLAALDRHDDVAGTHVCPVLDVNLDLQFGVEAAEHLLGYLHTGEDAFFLYQQLALAHGICRDAAQGSMVSVAYVLGKGEVNEAVVQLFYT